MKKSKIMMAVLFASLSLSQAFAGDVLERVKKTHTVSYGYRFAAFPYSFVNSDWNPIGYSYDICYSLHAKLEKAIGMKLDTKSSEVNNTNNIAWIKNGNIDIECGATTQTEERLKQVNATPIQADSVGIATKATFKGNSIDDLKGKSVITLAGTTAEKLLRKMNNEKSLGLTINLAKDYPNAFLLLGQNRGEAVISDTILLRGEIADSDKPNDFKVLDGKLNGVEPIGLVYSKDDAEWAKLIQATVDDMKKSGELERLYNKWFNSSIPPKDINFKIPLSAEVKKIVFN
jgi:glutamate/aspartate transport system substrate-binding protein